MNRKETPSDTTPQCPHCGEKLLRWETPEAGTWSHPWHWVCFNDECTYFVKGWTWMATNYNQHASYRFRLDPVTGEKGPVPVWSVDALKSGILQEDDDNDGGAHE